MVCKNPDQCLQITKKRYDAMEKGMDLVEDKIVQFREKYKNGEGDISFARHAAVRGLERSFNNKHILEALLNGFVMEYYYEAKSKQYQCLICYFLKLSPGVYRPVHIAVQMQSNDHLFVKTVYDPRSNPWKWNENFTNRICVCKTN
ncbi:DUF4258 domain-containing protein [Chengkuizengella axinellae]|uniref:DUF4258 domain-containing protein n=1 Tax=Chengkuizengella axinellae TaxID=3064388 RepID=A0ABT9J3I8_9BACL|nr:DUF4258 domain-containing protein [Chengkuizengella sp. 2205SS18-9]MDP5276174.1 DUF4258 domain-containing protein [Chengkuizengella sp. 2205SS18-9]